MFEMSFRSPQKALVVLKLHEVHSGLVKMISLAHLGHIEGVFGCFNPICEGGPQPSGGDVACAAPSVPLPMPPAEAPIVHRSDGLPQAPDV